MSGARIEGISTTVHILTFCVYSQTVGETITIPELCICCWCFLKAYVHPVYCSADERPFWRVFDRLSPNKLWLPFLYATCTVA